MLDFEKLKNILWNYNTFLITTHVNPDADAIGSVIALHRILKKLGKEVFIINHSETPYNLKFLDSENVIQKFNPDYHLDIIKNVNVIIVLDLNQLNRTVSMEKYLRDSHKPFICIDHHQNPERFTDNLFVDVNYCATGHILFSFLSKTKIVELDKFIAEPIYAAIMTDTGSFRFDRTTADVHRIIADLLEIGADPVYVYDMIYDQSHYSKIKLLGRALNSIKILKDSLAYMIISIKDTEETGSVEADVDGFVNYCLSIENIVIGILFYELKDGFKVSFRSKGSIPVNLLAKEFGGGGHTNASGARFYHANLNDNIEKILSSAEKYLLKME